MKFHDFHALSTSTCIEYEHVVGRSLVSDVLAAVVDRALGVATMAPAAAQLPWWQSIGAGVQKATLALAESINHALLGCLTEPGSADVGDTVFVMPKAHVPTSPFFRCAEVVAIHFDDGEPYYSLRDLRSGVELNVEAASLRRRSCERHVLWCAVCCVDPAANRL